MKGDEYVRLVGIIERLHRQFPSAAAMLAWCSTILLAAAADCAAFRWRWHPTADFISG
jgi:hypothetical protein